MFYPNLCICIQKQVKQSSDPTMVGRVVVAINQHGISLFNSSSPNPPAPAQPGSWEPATGRQSVPGSASIAAFPFESISSWQPANTYFLITLASASGKVNRLLFGRHIFHNILPFLDLGPYSPPSLPSYSRVRTTKNPGF